MAMDLQRIEIKNPTGILTDPNPSDLPPDSWTFGNNVKFKNGKTVKVAGHTQVFPTPPLAPLQIFPYLSDSTPFWISASDTKIHITSGSSWVDFSRLVGGSYNASVTNQWSGGFLSGVSVLNNSVDVPQSLLPTANNYTNLPNWPANYRCKIMRPFKNYLVALNLIVDSVAQPTTVKWSSPADPGEVPFTWDVNDATNDAGETSLADTAGAIVDARKLRDSLIIYKEDSVYSMRYIGGVYVFQFQQLFDDVGMLGNNCVAEFDGKHFVVGRGDVYVHNGVQKSSVIDGQMRDFLFNAIKSDDNQNTFVVPDYSNSEMWICFPAATGATSAGYCDKALIWNWKENKWAIRDLPNIISANTGIVDPQDSDAWEDDPLAWDSDSTTWGSQTYNPSRIKILLASNVDNIIYVVGESNTFAGVPITSTLEKSDLYFGDDQKVKAIHSLTPHLTGTGSAKVYIGTSMLQDSPVEWFGPYTFQIGQDYKVDCRLFGRYVGVRFQFDSEGPWTLNGYTLEFTPTAGKR
jgi:hypothetical protein